MTHQEVHSYGVGRGTGILHYPHSRSEQGRQRNTKEPEANPCAARFDYQASRWEVLRRPIRLKHAAWTQGFDE